VDAAKVIRTICDQRVTHMFGSPALLDRVGRFGSTNGTRLPTLRRVISAGAAVPSATLEQFGRMLDSTAEIHTPYGATEALPVASIGSREILGETRQLSDSGRGTCVGRPMPGMSVRIIRICDEPIADWSDDLVVLAGQVGEIAVKGPVVTHEYLNDSPSTRLAKIRDGDALWHRMGDVGWIDDKGRLWFCGRKAHRVQTTSGTLFTEPCEAIFNQHPAVFRSALVGVGDPPRQNPVICIELEQSQSGIDRARLGNELRDLAGRHDHTRAIESFLIHPRFPVDIRHNAKIFREKLAVWAAKQLGTNRP